MDSLPLTTEEMQVLELNAEYLGVTHSMLMQNAGREVARVISQNEIVKGKDITILCGLGGNGGDGMVAARYLQELGAQLRVFLIGSVNDISNPDTIANWDILNNIVEIENSQLKSESQIKAEKSIKTADILIDAMMGFGLRSKLRDPLLTAVKEFNKSTAVKYAIDVPTGIDSDNGNILGEAVKVKSTIALHAPKAGLSKALDFSGVIKVVSIGIPAEAGKICGPGDLSIFNRPRAKETRKGDYGKILVIGGSETYSGAPALTGLAALKTGADLVSIAAPEPVVSAIRSYSPNLMVTSIRAMHITPENLEALIELVKTQDVIALGPGLGIAPDTKKATKTLSEQIVGLGVKMVIDADGLKGIAGTGIKLNPSKCILTPHFGEIQILLGEKSKKSASLDTRIDHALSGAKLYNSVILLKGAVDVVAHPDGRYKLNRTGVPAMSVGGTGDVLTGIVAALLAHGKGAFNSAAAAAFISGKAGELAFEILGDHLMATDCIEQIPAAMK